MKKPYEKATIEFAEFETEDIITASGTDTPFEPANFNIEI